MKYKGEVWEIGEYNEKVVVITYMKKTRFINKPIKFDINILGLLAGKYLGNNREWLEESFYEVIEE